MKFKRVPSVGKVMTSVFWDCEGMLKIEYIQKIQTCNGEYDDSNLRQLKEAVKSESRGKLSVGVLLIQYNAPVQTASGRRRNGNMRRL